MTAEGTFAGPGRAGRGFSVKAAAFWSGKAPGVYFTFNPVKPALLARASNRMQERPQ